MDDRTALLLTWLEEEGERQRRPILPPPQAKDPALRGWVQVGLCALGGSLAAALFVCWLGSGWERAVRMAMMEEYRLECFRAATGDPNRPALAMPWWRRGGGRSPLLWLDDRFVRGLYWGVGAAVGVLAASLLAYRLTAARVLRSGWPRRKRAG